MHKRIRAILQYLLIVAAMTVLVWFSLSNIETSEDESKVEFILRVGASADLLLLGASGALLLIGHIIRAQRWKLLLDPLGNKLSFQDSLLSVLIGYFVNLAIPRGGELTRCYNLYKLNGTPVPRSLGTVVAERVVDMFFLLSFIGGAFLLELDTLTYFFSNINLSGGESKESGSDILVYALGGMLSVLVVVLLFLFLIKSHYYRVRLLAKVKAAAIGIKQGLLVVFRLEKRAWFIIYSVLIWVCYYLMSFFVIIAFPETNHLGLLATLTIFAIGGVAMAIPLPGGTGSYHVLVPGGLVLLYGLSQDKAAAFTFLFHGWQTLLVIVFGVVSLFISQMKIRRASK